MDRYADLERGYSEQEIAIARKSIGMDALMGIGYGQDYKVALRTARIALRSVVH